MQQPPGPCTPPATASRSSRAGLTASALAAELGDGAIGYPIWNYELPSPVNTFLDQHDFNGKNIILFSTHGGNQLADTVATITDKLSAATVNQNAFTVSRDDMDRAESEVGSWLDGLN